MDISYKDNFGNRQFHSVAYCNRNIDYNSIDRTAKVIAISVSVVLIGVISFRPLVELILFVYGKII